MSAMQSNDLSDPAERFNWWTSGGCCRHQGRCGFSSEEPENHRLFITRVRRLAQRFGNLKGMEKLGVKPHSSQEESDEDLYESLRSSLIPEDWVGPIEASLEMC